MGNMRMINPKGKYRIVPYTQTRSTTGLFKDDRFAIINERNEIVDDAQGWGYKTKQSAFKALNYKTGGVINEQTVEKEFHKWVKRHTNSKEIMDRYNDLVGLNFKELARNETTVADIWIAIEEEYGPVPSYIKHYLSIYDWEH